MGENTGKTSGFSVFSKVVPVSRDGGAEDAAGGVFAF